MNFVRGRTSGEHFEGTIHTNRELSEREVFVFKIILNWNSELRAIKVVRMAEANYAVAVKMLQERLGRHTALVDDRIGRVLAITPLDRSSHVSQLRELYEEVHFRTRYLDRLGVPASEYVVMLHCVLMWSLPEDVAILYCQHIKEIKADDGATPRPR